MINPFPSDIIGRHRQDRHGGKRLYGIGRTRRQQIPVARRWNCFANRLAASRGRLTRPIDMDDRSSRPWRPEHAQQECRHTPRRRGAPVRSECETGWGDGLSVADVSGILDHPPSRMTSDGEVHGSAFSRRDASEFCWKIPCPRKRGRRECRAPNAPAAWQGRKTSHASKVTTVTPEITRHSPHNGFTAYFVLSPVTGLSCHRHRRNCFHQLDTSVGVSGPHDFAVRETAPRQRTASRPPHPAAR